MATIEIYTNDPCWPCKKTKEKFFEAEKVFEEIPAADHTEFLRDQLGYQQAPVVVIRDEHNNIIDHWGGLRPDKIKEYSA